MKLVDELVFKFNHLESKLKKIHDFVVELKDSFQDEKKNRRLLAIARNASQDLSKVEDICLRLNNAFIKEPSSQPENFDVDKKLSVIQDWMFDIDSAIEGAQANLVDPNQTINKTDLSFRKNDGDFDCNSLPPIKLIEFNGSSLLSWLHFRDIFQALVIDDKKLSKVKKFLYLRSSLKEEALSLVVSLPITNDNFDLAWKLLCDRYNDDRALTNCYLESLIDFPTIHRNNSSLKQASSSIKEFLGALQQIGHAIDEWNPILVFILRRKLVSELVEKWESSVLSTSNPTHKDFVDFLSNEAKILEGLNLKFCKEKSNISSPKGKRMKTLSLNVTSPATVNTSDCPYCRKNHTLINCVLFIQNTPKDRYNFVKANSLCCRCLSNSHFLKNCRSKIKCCYCDSPNHSSLLHFDTKPQPCSTPPACRPTEPQQTCKENTLTTCAVMNFSKFAPEVVLLSTAVAHVKDNLGQLHRIRILLDTGSQGTFITRSFTTKVKLPVENASVPIQGMASTNLGLSLGKVSLTLLAPFNAHIVLECKALVVNKIAKCPQVLVENKTWSYLAGLKLADPTWFEPGEIDLLLGSEYIAEVMLGNTVVGPKGSPSAIETIWGYTLVGKVCGLGPLHSFCTLTDLDLAVHKFWTIEEPPSVKTISDEDKIANDIFDSTVSRRPCGRFVVKLPFKKHRSLLGETRSKALNRFLSLESRLVKNPLLYGMYKDFMKDYAFQGHMIPASPLPSGKECYYVPHHCIQNPKFKVVFDFSMPSRESCSLNNVLYSGEKLLLNLLDILLKFRLHPIVIITDISQFYRNIALSEDHWDYQRIFWRDSPSKPLLEYFLTTVTYGVVSSPYLAIKTIRRLIDIEGEPYPLASTALLESAYMDDIVRSLRTLEEGFRLREELVDLLAKGGFTLKKWVSNCPQLLHGLNKEDVLLSTNEFDFSFSDAESSAKILGLAWNPTSDILSYRINLIPQEITKRKILSELAQLWDPLGYLSPVIFIGKLILRFVWQSGLDWDDTPSQDICQRWTKFRLELPLLKSLSIPRLFHHSPGSVQLHCFADASENGYGSVVYFLNSFKAISKTSLILSKTKISPIKQISLPRLELCALLLASRLVNYIINLFSDLSFDSVVIWSDSMVALHWVRSSPHRWKTFIANRVSQIQELIPNCQFRYIPSSLNVADIASRGCFPSELLASSSWWAGPEFLLLSEENWPQIPPTLDDRDEVMLEAKEVKVLASFTRSPLLLEDFSSLSRLRRITAWIFRFINNCRSHSKSQERFTGSLTTSELRDSLLFWVKFVQGEDFREVLVSLRCDKLLVRTWRKLCPFIDSEGVIRVGGRLENSALPFSRKHPILLPKSSHLTMLIVDYYHNFWMHPGPSTIHYIIRNQFWIISGRSVVKRRLLKCLKCYKSKPASVQPLMGNLPACRLSQVKPFGITGVDYAGPLLVKSSRLRKAVKTKAYICLFVCFATKAIHLELASDLSTDTFLAAFRRFVARRGPIFEMHSDNGTNFVGAKNKLDHWSHLTNSQDFMEQGHQWLSDQGIKWSFTPSFSPHMGSIWEANIKSTKRLLFSSIGSQILTFEELNTVLVQIEAVLNSRPLIPLSSDPNDPQVLTPSHFLVQGPPGSILEPYTPLEPLSLRNRWKLVQQVVASFWQRWHKEYLNSLQLRYKWNKSSPNLVEGSLVLLKDPNLPPLKWKLGRIVRIFPGKDGVVRVADVRLSSGLVVNRAVVKLCPLPLQD